MEMNGANIDLEPQVMLREGKKKRVAILQNKLVKKITLLTLLLGIWSSLVYGGYWLANKYIVESKNYIDEQIALVNKQNQKELIALQNLNLELEGMQTELTKLQAELAVIQENLSLTEETLNGTDQTKQSLEKRITDLSKQLAKLQTAIDRLEDAAK